MTKDRGRMMDMALPLVVEDITSDWLTRALAFKSPDVKVLDSRILNVHPGTSTKIRVSVTYNPAGAEAGLPTRFIVKGGFEKHSPPMAAMYEREARFYREVAPFIPMNVPECYYAGSDPESHQSIVIMEDLDLKNAVMCHALAAHDFSQASRRMDAMAKYHAHTWNSAEFAPGGRFDWVIARFEGFGRTHNARYLKPDVWQRMLATPRGAAVSNVFHDFDWMIGAMEKLGEFHRNSPCQSILHGDAHPGNMYIERDGTPGFFDNQVIRGPWHYDVAKYLVCTLDIADRRNWDRALVAYYLERLRHYGVEPPEFDDAWEAYRHEIVYSLAMFVINETAFQPEAVNTAYTARCSAAGLDHGIKDLMR